MPFMAKTLGENLYCVLNLKKKKKIQHRLPTPSKKSQAGQKTGYLID